MRARPRRARRVREVRRRRRPARLRDGLRYAPAPPVAVRDRVLGRRLPRVLLVHGSRHALGRARLARGSPRLRRRLHGLPGRRRVARAAGDRHGHLEDWWLLWGRVAGRARAREMHAGRREPPRQPLEERVGARRRLDAGVAARSVKMAKSSPGATTRRATSMMMSGSTTRTATGPTTTTTTLGKTGTVIMMTARGPLLVSSEASSPPKSRTRATQEIIPKPTGGTGGARRTARRGPGSRRRSRRATGWASWPWRCSY